jgi:hypothetical protein
MQHSPEPATSTSPTPLEMVEQVMDLSVGAVTALMPALLLAMPAIILLALVVIPLALAGAVLAVVGLVAAAPYLLFRSIRRAGIGRTRRETRTSASRPVPG